MRRPMRLPMRVLAACALIAVLVDAPATAAGDPPVPHGLDPGGIAIALITDGIDYTDPEIATRLARDGEGEPIALDLIDGDVRPYAPANAGNGTAVAKRLLATYKHSRLIVVRVDALDGAALAKSAMFVSRTPARIAAVGFWSQDKALWQPFSSAASQAGQVLFIVPGGNASARAKGDVYPAGFKSGNSVIAAPFEAAGDQYAPALGDEAVDAWVVAPGQTMFGGVALAPPKDSVEAAALLAGQAACTMHGADPASLADAKSVRAAVLAQAKPIETGALSSTRVHDPMCWYGGVPFGNPGRF